jgi:DNA-directed RNA polymerase specialized sigma24 family protein
MTDSDGDSGVRDAPSTRATPLEILLDHLAAGGDAAPAYEHLRLRLVSYFRLRFPPEAEALADEAIDRLARRLDDGIPVMSLAGYALGIARLLVLETSARQSKERIAARAAMFELEIHHQEIEPDPAQPALRKCLEAIGPESAAFILDYYSAEAGAARIARRQALAEHSGLTLNALRNRALRIRIGLEKCVRARLQSAIPRSGLLPDSKSRGDETANSDTRHIMRPGPVEQ